MKNTQSVVVFDWICGDLFVDIEFISPRKNPQRDWHENPTRKFCFPSVSRFETLFDIALARKYYRYKDLF